MYLHHHDPDQGLAVWLFDKGTPEEWNLHFDHLGQIATWSAKTGRRAATMLIPLSFERPDSRRRTELARATEAAGYDPYVAFVMPNVALRGILTMFGWVQKAPKYEMKFTSTRDDAYTWLEARRGGPLPDLRERAEALVTEHQRLTASS